MTSITKDGIGLFQLRRKPYFPYITFNLIRRYCEIGDNAYKYQSHGGWFMVVFGLLPVIWTTCPFTWQVGLFNGTVLALVFNVITYILFSNKIERIETAVATQDINTQSPEQNLSLQMMEERNKAHNYRLYSKLFVIVLGMLPGIWRSCPFTWQAGLIIGIAIAIVFNIITSILFYNKIKRIAASVNIQDIVQDVITQRSSSKTLQQIMEQQDSLCVLCRECELTDESGNVLAWLNEDSAQLFSVSNAKENYRVAVVTWRQLANLVEMANGLTIFINDSSILYQGQKDHVLSILRPTQDCPLDWNKPYFIAQINGQYVVINHGLCVADSESAMQSMLDEIVASDDKEEILYRTLQDIAKFMQQEKTEEIYFITNNENSQIPSRSLIAAPKNTTDAQKQTNNCMHIDPERSYFVSLDDTNLFMISENGKHYILITDNEECMQRTLLKFKDTANDKPVQEHISAIINWIETSDDIDGLYFAGDNDYQLFSKEELASMTFRDFLDIKIEEKCHDKQDFFAIMRQDDDESWYYVTSGGHLAVFLTDLDTNLCASKNGFERFKVKEIHPKDILHVVQECDGLKIMGCDGLVLYENNVKHVTKILQKYIN